MNRIRMFDHLRGVAIICVLLMHNTLTYVFAPREILIDSFLHNLVTVGVPLFFFMSGFFLAFDRSPNFTSFYKKKLIRVYLPTVVWTVLFWALFSATGEVREFNLGSLFWNLLLFREPGHYYFIFVLMILFAGRHLFLRIDAAQLRALLAIAFALNLATIAVYEIVVWTVETPSIPGVLMYRNPLAWIFFFVYGVYVSRTDRELAGGWIRYLGEKKWLGLVVMTGLWVITSLETRHLFHKLAPGGQDYFKVTSFFYEFLALNYLLILFKTSRVRGLADSALTLLAKYSFFIYLIHIPTVPKLLSMLGVHETLVRYHYPSILLNVALSIGIPLLLAALVHRLRRYPDLHATVCRLIGLPA